jgi:hypothetical protein
VKKALAEEYSYDCGAPKLSNNQRNRIIRDDLEFEMRPSHGRQRVYITIGNLIKMADEWSVQDDLIEEWRKET